MPNEKHQMEFLSTAGRGRGVGSRFMQRRGPMKIVRRKMAQRSEAVMDESTDINAKGPKWGGRRQGSFILGKSPSGKPSAVMLLNRVRS